VKPAATASLTLFAGLVGLGVGVWGSPWLAPSPVAECPTPEPSFAMSDEELRVACLPVMRRVATTLSEVQLQVDALAVQVRDKETEVQRLEAEVRGNAMNNADLVQRLDAARVELEQLQGNLQAAVEDQAALQEALDETRVILQSTREALSQQQERTRAAREDAADQRWESFVNETQLALCKDGNRLARCREVVETSVAKWEKRFKDCLRSDSAVPQLRQLRPSEDLPSFAVLLDPDSLTTAGWYVLFCDPSLPEAGRLRAPTPGPGVRPEPAPVMTDTPETP
jgi:hypothetical protein